MLTKQQKRIRYMQKPMKEQKRNLKQQPKNDKEYICKSFDISLI